MSLRTAPSLRTWPRPAACTRLRPFSLSSRVRSAPPPDIFRADKAAVYPFGVPSNDPKRSLFPSLSLTVRDADCWAILAPTSSSPTRAALVATLRHQVRFDPISSASHPILATLPPVERPADEGGPRDRTVDDLIQFVSFKTRLGRGSDFDDYTARYYSIRDEDKLTVRQHLRDATGADDAAVEDKAAALQMETLLDLPLITLSNGQTRRARVLRALLARPELIILEEPFTGLDAPSRAHLATLLASLHAARSPRVLLVLRPQDVLPPFVTHLALADATGDRSLALGPRGEVLAGEEARALLAAGEREREASVQRAMRRREAGERAAKETEGRKALVELKGVNVTYGREEDGQVERRILRDLDWTVRAGERWLLAGHNGSGKSTLLALVLGDHPRSFNEDVTLFGQPRYRRATATLQQNIGHVSPEIFNAFPRKHGPEALTAYESIVTGFESVYSYRRATAEQASAIDALVRQLDHPLVTPEFLARPLAALSAGEQSLVLLLRALVKRPPLLVLDEPFSGMDRQTVDKVQRFLDEELDEDQAVIMITHFEEEVPQSINRVLRLEEGKVVEHV